MSDEEFFEAESPLDAGRTRGDNLRDNIELLGEELYTIEQTTRGEGGRFTLPYARKALVEARELLDKIDDDLCERDEHGSRKDGGDDD
jgi:hypothetical protein